jgi:hypothetical protein
LYAQITEGLIKLMKRVKENNLFQFLKEFDLTSKAAEYVKSLTDFNLDFQMQQRKLVEMGRVVGRIISLNQVLELANKGFRKDLVDSGITMLHQDISKLMATFSFNNKTEAFEDYEENSSWLNFVRV